MWKKTLLLITVLIFALCPGISRAADNCSDLSDPQERVVCYTQKVNETRGQEKSLSTEISKINNEISLTSSRIDLTQAKLDRLNNDIASVSGKITIIEDSLNHVSEVLVKRITATYIAGRVDPVLYLLSSANFDDFVGRLNFLQIAQKHDKKLMFEMAATKKNYHDQKNLLVEKKKQVEVLSAQLSAYKTELDRQNREKNSLLQVTKNDEQRYQSLLSQAQLELSALSASRFSEKKNVKRGDPLGVMGSTGFSTGPHLHFGVYSLAEDRAANFNYNSDVNNPTGFLKSREVHVESGACYEFSGQRNMGSGSWEWPLDNPSVSQCYGKTPYSFVYNNGLHMGIDLYQLPLSFVIVKAVDDGVAYFYRDSGNGFGNNARVFHSNGKMTLYLHMQ